MNLMLKLKNSIAVRSLSIITVCCLGMLIFIGCRTNRAITSVSKQDPGQQEKNMISLLDQSNEKFRTMKARRADLGILINGIQNGSNGSIAIYRDSLIAVSIIPALGYEALRILCTQDSVIVINRMEKSYYASSFTDAGNKYNIPVGFSELQAILMNEVFYYKDDYKDRLYDKQRYSKNGKNIFLIDASREDRRLTRQEIGIDSTGLNMQKVFVIDYETRMQLDLDYEDFRVNGSFKFPQTLSMKIADNKNAVQLNIRYGQIVFDDSINVEFVVPQNYKRETL